MPRSPLPASCSASKQFPPLKGRSSERPSRHELLGVVLSQGVLSNHFQYLFCAFEGPLRLRNLCACSQQGPRDAGVVALVPLPAIQRAVKRPAKGSSPELIFYDVDRSITSQQCPDRCKVAVPGRVVQSGLIVFELGIDRPAIIEQQFQRPRV